MGNFVSTLDSGFCDYVLGRPVLDAVVSPLRWQCLWKAVTCAADVLEWPICKLVSCGAWKVIGSVMLCAWALWRTNEKNGVVHGFDCLTTWSLHYTLECANWLFRTDFSDADGFCFMSDGCNVCCTYIHNVYRRLNAVALNIESQVAIFPVV